MKYEEPLAASNKLFNQLLWTPASELPRKHNQSIFLLQEKANGGQLFALGTQKLVPTCFVPWLSATNSPPFPPRPLWPPQHPPRPLRVHLLKSQPKVPKAQLASLVLLVRTPILPGYLELELDHPNIGRWSSRFHCLMKTGSRFLQGLPPTYNSK